MTSNAFKRFFDAAKIWNDEKHMGEKIDVVIVSRSNTYTFDLECFVDYNIEEVEEDEDIEYVGYNNGLKLFTIALEYVESMSMVTK